MLEAPRIVQTEPQRVACLPLVVSRADIRHVMGPGLDEVLAAMAAQGHRPAGPWLTHHLRMDPESFDFEICVPVDADIVPVGRVRPGMLRAAAVARTVYHGDYEGLADAWGELMTWIEAQALTPADDLWECYTIGPETSDDPADWRTELNRPLT